MAPFKKPKDNIVQRNKKAMFGKTSPMKKARAIYQPVIMNNMHGRTALSKSKVRKQSLPEMQYSNPQMQRTQDQSAIAVYTAQHIQTLPSAHKRQATPLELEPHMNPFSPDRILAVGAAA